MTMRPLSIRASLLRQLCAGTPFECLFGAFDDGPVVGVEVADPFRIGHFAIAYFDEASVKLSFSVPAEGDKGTGTSVLEDQLILAISYAVPYWPDL
jgi:hypothetical protein